jgi:hypothetical protein
MLRVRNFPLIPHVPASWMMIAGQICDKSPPNEQACAQLTWHVEVNEFTDEFTAARQGPAAPLWRLD